MGKIQELHALLDDAVSESDLAPAIRVAQVEVSRAADTLAGTNTMPISADTKEQVLEISRLLIRLAVASSGLKVAVVAGRVLGDLLGKCGAKVPVLDSFYFELGRSVVTLLVAFAEGGPAVWSSASIKFPTGAQSDLYVSSKRHAVALLMLWNSALIVFSRICRLETKVGQLQCCDRLRPAAVVLDAVYRVTPACDVPPACFTFLCNALVSVVDVGLVSDGSHAVADLFKWLGQSLDRHASLEACRSVITSQTMSDVMKTTNSLANMTERLLLAGRISSMPLEATIAKLSQDLLAQFVAPIGPTLPLPPDNVNSPPSPGSCVSFIGAALLHILWKCVERVPVFSMDISVLLRCCTSHAAQHYGHLIVITTARHGCSSKDMLRGEISSLTEFAALVTTVDVMREWILTSSREVALAEQSIKEWLMKNSTILHDDSTDSIELLEDSKLPDSLGSYDITDVKQLESLLAWDATGIDDTKSEHNTCEPLKRRRLNPISTKIGLVGPSAPLDLAGSSSAASNGCFHLAGIFHSSLQSGCRMDEAVGVSPHDAAGLASYVKKTTIDILRAVDDFLYMDFGREPSQKQLHLLFELVSTSGLVMCLSSIIGRSHACSELENSLSGQVESVISLLFYVYAAIVEVALHVCQLEIADEKFNDLKFSGRNCYKEKLLLVMVNNMNRLIICSKASDIGLNGWHVVPKAPFLKLLSRIILHCDQLNMSTDIENSVPNICKDDGVQKLFNKLGNDDFIGNNLDARVIFQLAAFANLSPSEHKTGAFWTDSSSHRKQNLNLKSPFPLLELLWNRRYEKHYAQAVCFAMESFLAVKFSPALRERDRTVEATALCISQEDGSQAGRPPASIPVHQDDSHVVGAIWLCRAAISVFSVSVRQQECQVLCSVFSMLSCVFSRLMDIILASFPKCVTDAVRKCSHFCSLLSVDQSMTNASSELQRCLTHFHLLDIISMSTLPKGELCGEVEMAEYRRRALISEILPAIGTLWLSAELLLKCAIPELSNKLKAHDTSGATSSEDMCVYIEFVSTARALFGMVRCFHLNRNVELQSSSRHVLASMDHLIKEFVVTVMPLHSVTNRVATALSVAMLDHAVECNVDMLKSEDASKSDCSFLCVVGRMLTNASIKAAKLPDADDYPCGVEGRHSLLRILVSTMADLIQFCAVTRPEVSFWALNQLTKAWLDHKTSWHWAYQIFFEYFLRLGRVRPNGDNNSSCLLQLLTSAPKLTAEEFLLPLVHSDTALLSEIIENILRIRPLDRFLSFFVQHLVSVVVLMGDITSYRTLANRYPNLIFRYDDKKGDYDLSLSSLFESTPLILYEILMSDQIQQYDDIQIVMNYLPQHLMKSIRALKLSNEFDIRTDKPTGGRALQRYLLHAIWDTGVKGNSGNANGKEQAEKALRVISAIYTTDSWVGGVMDDDSPSNPWQKYMYQPSPGKGRKAAVDILSIRKNAMKEFTADLVPSHFLYIMSHLIQKNWDSQSDHRKEQAVFTVISLVKLVRPDAISKFLPKVIVALDAALCSLSARVRAAGAKLASVICLLLPFEALSSSISALIVGLFPIMETFRLSGDREKQLNDDLIRTSSFRNSSDDNIYIDLKNCLSLYSTEPFPAACAIDSKLPKVAGLLAELSYYGSLEASFNKEAFDFAVNTMKSVFDPERPEFEQLFDAVPYIPDIPELTEIRERHSRFLASASLDKSIEHLCTMLRHESSQVRVVVLRRLLSIIREKRRLVFPAEFANGKSCSILSMLISHLLSLCSRENDRTAKDICAQCLGELGAVDPARVSIKLLNSSSTSPALMKLILGKESGVNTINEYSASLPPWDFTVWSLGFFLLHEHLIPALRAANGAGDVAAQDFSGIAIQEILKILADAVNQDEAVSESTDTSPADGEMQGTMPAKLRAALNELQLFDITEPFWSTKYNLGFIKRPYKSDIYMGSQSFLAWMSSWCLQLISCSRSIFEPLYRACRGAVRHRPELGQFLLPYLIVDAVKSTEGNQSIYAAVIAEIKGVLTMCLSSSEINVVERNISLDCCFGEQSMNKEQKLQSAYADMREVRMTSACQQLSVQGIFGLMDQFSAWSVLGDLESRRKSKLSLSSKDSLHAVNWEASYRLINQVCNDIPAHLLGTAALSIRAYARSARYFEVSARESHQADRHSYQLAVGDRVEYDISSMKPPAGSTAGKAKEGKSRNTSLNNSSTSIVASEILTCKSRRDLAHRCVHDGANGELPYLSKELLDNLLTIFAHLDDNDALNGVQTSRHKFQIPSTPWNRIVEFEQMDQWLDALREYDLLESLAYSESRVWRDPDESHGMTFTEENTEETEEASYTMAQSQVRTLGATCLGGSQETSEGMVEDVLESQSVVQNGSKLDQCVENAGSQQIRHALLSFVERGKLRCLLEMGHTKLAYDEWQGLTNRDPAVSNSVLALGVEATWRLQQWGQLENMSAPSGRIGDLRSDLSNFVDSRIPKEFSADDMFMISSGNLLLHFQKCNKEEFRNILSGARQRVMSFLSAASMESYSRCYPALVQLHVLQEFEQSYECKHSGLGAEEQENMLRQNFDWERRFALLSPSFKQRSKVLTARRASLNVLKLPNAVAESWLTSCRALRHLGRFDTAMIALRNAEASGVGTDVVLLEESMLLKDSKNIRKALMLIEPEENLLNHLKALTLAASQSRKPAHQSIMSEESARVLANRLLLATTWMAESKLAHGREILERFKVVLYLHKDWEDALFHLAKYNDDLFESKYKDMKTHNMQPSDEDKAMMQLAVSALDNYGKCMKVGSKYILQAAPKFLSVYFSVMALRAGPSGQRGSGTEGSIIAQAQRAMASRAIKYMGEVDPAKWYTCMPQIVSRVGHPSPDAIRFVKGALHNILVTFPEQGIWHISSLLHSLNKDRASVGKILVKDAIISLEKKRRFQSSAMLQESILLFNNLVDLAQNQAKDRRIRWSIGTECQLTNFLVPSQSALTIVFPSTDDLASDEHAVPYFPSDEEYFQGFDCSVEVMMTKAKPKKISATTTTGRSIRFLLKQEKYGDLRKDARLMEFNTVVNRLLQEEPESRKRNLRLRTFCVICLNEECGIMEWVPNTMGLRSLVAEAHSGNLDEYPYLDLRKIKDIMENMQSKYIECNLEELLSEYKRLILNNYRPCFHKWFLARFRDPTEWLEARDRFTRSSAVWSSIGHVVGLGDRHGDNIMLDIQLGECVHVDFDCLFDKGLKLQRPEIVPFRLSPSMVDAMGIFGYEGTFRRTMEVCLYLLRNHKDTLIGVLEPFIRDPTVAWGRGGRAQQRESALSHAHSAGASFQDTENKDAEDALVSISERLSGIYNVAHPKAVKIVNAYRADGRVLPKIGLAASQEDALNLPLSVEGQVDRLINEAVAEINLAQMYHGWMPWS